MERRFEIRLQQLLAQAEVPPQALGDGLRHLEEFLRPFIAHYRRPEQRVNARAYVSGLVSDLESKTAEGIAYLHDRDRQGLQKFVGQGTWDEQPLIRELVRQVADELGERDGVLVFDPSAFAKKGTASVGVARQWCGRLGKIDNCQVGVYLGYVSRKEHALVDVRLYLSREWTGDRVRRREAGVPRDVRFRTRHALALAMLDAHATALPHGWIAGDDEMGKSAEFRGDLRSRHECYLLAVPGNTLVRDLEAEPPAYGGHGSQPRVAFARAEGWAAARPARAWESVEVRAGSKGPLVVEGVRVRVQTMYQRHREGPEELLVVFRERQGDGSWKHDYLLSNAPPETPLAELARVFKAEHRIEECLQRAKGEAGLADYEVRNWVGWHHHQALSLVAAWFLTRETRRGKNADRGPDGSAGPLDDRVAAPPRLTTRRADLHRPHPYPLVAPQRDRPVLSLEKT